MMVGVVGSVHWSNSMIHRLDCWHFREREPWCPRSEPMSVKEAQALCDEVNMAVCFVCRPPITGGTKR